MRLAFSVSLLLTLIQSSLGQDTAVVLTPAMILPKDKVIPLQLLDGWIFRKGSDIRWAEKNIDTAGWEKRKPSELSKQLADKDGKLECWLRISVKLDSALENTPFDFFVHGWAATDIYIDGTFFNSYGNTGLNGKPFKEYNSNNKLPIAFNVDRRTEHVIAVHFVDFVSSFPPYHLRSGWRLNYFIALILPERKALFIAASSKIKFYQTLWLAVNSVICMLFWLLAFQNSEERNLRMIAVTSTLISLLLLCYVLGDTSDISYFVFAITDLARALITPLTIISALVLVARIFHRRITFPLKILLLLILLLSISLLFFQNSFLGAIPLYLSIGVSGYFVLTSWKTLKGAQWAVVIGILMGIGFGCLGMIYTPAEPTTTSLLLATGLYLAFPLSLVVYVAMRFREIINEVRYNAKEIVRLSEEKREQALNQQQILQEEVNRQTSELRNTLNDLRATQSQLIQSEKMASLGELTAGIAHEIQNPLNFVNNFSDVNRELVDDAKQEIKNGNIADVDAILNDIRANEEKINHHGKRADAIVKGMLQHSRTSSGQKEPTDINKLADEYLRLAYHGLKAKDKTFNAEIKTDFDTSIGKINVVPQYIGRVILNLINNAFYAVGEKQKVEGPGYQPSVTVSTKRLGDRIQIKVGDNGNGIPQNIVDKIFQPFFTTKPTGQGTGLGLSLAYDIIKAHGGEIKVEMRENGGSEFIILLPIYL
jgi:signal transduction histidine kinase